MKRTLLLVATVLVTLAAVATRADADGSGRLRLASRAQEAGLYVALGDSISAGLGASSLSKSWVQLYYGFLESNGSGVTEFRNLGAPGVTSTDVRNQQLARAVAAIGALSDTKAVTLDVGINDIGTLACPTANAPTCAVADNLRVILAGLNMALAADPGDETVQVMEYYNPEIGTPIESATRQSLLGSDGKVDCAGTGAALGLNDLIHCITIEQGAKPIDVLPLFDAGGEAFLAADHSHPNDAGHLAIANAFGGAAAPTAAEPPPPTAPTLRAGRPHISLAAAGKQFTAWVLVTNADTGAGVKGQVTCRGKISGRSLRARSPSHSSSSSGKSSCTWQLPAVAHAKLFTGSITSRFQGATVTRAFSTKVK